MGMNNTRDPVTALRSILTPHYVTDRYVANDVIEALAEQGYVLVNAEGLERAERLVRQALRKESPESVLWMDGTTEHAAAIFAVIQEQKR